MRRQNRRLCGSPERIELREHTSRHNTLASTYRKPLQYFQVSRCGSIWRRLNISRSGWRKFRNTGDDGRNLLYLYDAKSGTTKTYLISIGGGTCTTAIPYTEVRDMEVATPANVVDTTLVSNCGEEQSGFRNVLTGGGRWCGLYVGFNAINSHYEDLTIYSQPGAYAIITLGDTRMRFSDLTLNGSFKAGLNNSAFLVLNGHPTINNVHCENVYNCIDVVSYGTISNVDCSPASVIYNACIVIEKSGTALIDTLTSNGSVTPLIQDFLNRNGAIYSDYDLYLYNSAPNFLVTSSPNIASWVIPDSLTIPAIKSATGFRYVCVDNTGKLISQANPCVGT